MITTCWELGGSHYVPARVRGTAWELGQGCYALARSRPCRWAHMLGHGGHFLTQSRRYSVTFGQLRRDRQDHRRAERHPLDERDPWGRPLDDAVVLVLHTWTYAGTSYTTPARTSRSHRPPGPVLTTRPCPSPESITA